MKLILSVLVLAACSGSALAQTDRTVAGVRADFREASVVVRMNITDTRVTGRDDPYAYYFIASGQVTTSFKGKFKAGQRLEFSVRAEYPYDHTGMRGDNIAFLTSFVNRTNGPFQVFPSGNSVFPYSSDLLAKTRTVSRERHRRRRTRN